MKGRNMTKYKININHLDSKHGIHRLERDGFSREKIIKTMYKITEGMSTPQRTELMNRLYDRSEK